MRSNELFLAISKGKKEALALLYERAYKKLYAVALKYVRSEADAEEIVADVFIKLWNNRKTLSKVQKEDAYLFMVLRNLCYDHLRKLQNRQVFLSIEAQEPFQSTMQKSTPETKLLEQEQLEMMERILANLPERQYKAFQLLRIEGMSYKEVAQEMGISVSAVEKLISKATKSLMQGLPSKGKSIKCVGLILGILFFI